MRLVVLFFNSKLTKFLGFNYKNVTQRGAAIGAGAIFERSDSQDRRQKLDAAQRL